MKKFKIKDDFEYTSGQGFFKKIQLFFRRFKRIKLIPVYDNNKVKIWGKVSDLKARFVSGECVDLFSKLMGDYEGALSVNARYGIRYGDPVELKDLRFVECVIDNSFYSSEKQFIFKCGECFISIGKFTYVKIFSISDIRH